MNKLHKQLKKFNNHPNKFYFRKDCTYQHGYTEGWRDALEWISSWANDMENISEVVGLIHEELGRG